MSQIKMSKEIEETILEALSFYDPMTKDEIILDLDDGKIQENPDFSLEVFENKLESLLKNEKVKMIKNGKNISYLRLFPKRKSWPKRVFSRIFSNSL